MNEVAPRLEPLVIDREGTLRPVPLHTWTLHDRLGADRRPDAHAWAPLDGAQLWRGDRGLCVRFKPDRITKQALTRLLYLLAEWPTRVLLHTDTRKHELLGNGSAAVARVIALAEEATKADAAGAVLFEPVQPAILRGRSPLHDLIENWRARVGWRDFASFVGRACERASGRFVLFEHERDRDTFVFRDFGAGIPNWAKYSLQRHRGRALDDLHGDQFGTSCSFAYRDALQKLAPTVQMVDANIRWPKFGMRRSCYWRVALPMADPAGRLWLLSATLADSAIDLREAGAVRS